VKLTGEQWREVFLYRCRKRRGEALESRESELVDRAFEEDFGRYAAMFPDILGATDPAYAAARARKFPPPPASSSTISETPMPRTTTVKLSEEQWREVFRLRCRCKRGEALAVGESELVERARREDRDRYVAMDADVFDATVPFGSCRRAGR
jgi:hypothetical protein